MLRQTCAFDLSHFARWGLEGCDGVKRCFPVIDCQMGGVGKAFSVLDLL